MFKLLFCDSIPLNAVPGVPVWARLIKVFCRQIYLNFKGHLRRKCKSENGDGCNMSPNLILCHFHFYIVVVYAPPVTCPDYSRHVFFLIPFSCPRTLRLSRSTRNSAMSHEYTWLPRVFIYFPPSPGQCCQIFQGKMKIKFSEKTEFAFHRHRRQHFPAYCL